MSIAINIYLTYTFHSAKIKNFYKCVWNKPSLPQNINEEETWMCITLPFSKPFVTFHTSSTSLQFVTICVHTRTSAGTHIYLLCSLTVKDLTLQCYSSNHARNKHWIIQNVMQVYLFSEKLADDSTNIMIVFEYIRICFDNDFSKYNFRKMFFYKIEIL